MFDKVKEAATNAAIKSVQRTLDLMELAALASLDRPTVRG